MDDARDSLSALDEFGAEAFISLPHMTLAELLVAVGVGDAADEAVANTDDEQRVEN